MATKKFYILKADASPVTDALGNPLELALEDSEGPYTLGEVPPTSDAGPPPDDPPMDQQ